MIIAATVTFSKINPDHDLTLEAAETRHILTAEEWKQFNADGDTARWNSMNGDTPILWNQPVVGDFPACPTCCNLAGN